MYLLLGSEGRQGGVTPWVRRDRARAKKARWKDKVKERMSEHLWSHLSSLPRNWGYTSLLPTFPQRMPKLEADRKGTGTIRGQTMKRADRGFSLICVCSFGAEQWGGWSTQD